MNKYVISCCSTADLKKSHFENRNIKYICFHYELNGKDYYDDLGESMPFPEFYKAMENGAETKTSQVSLGEFQTYFENFLQKNLDIIHISMSSGLSGAFNSALAAKKLLSEK